jgi:hypothetical protein
MASAPKTIVDKPVETVDSHRQPFLLPRDRDALQGAASSPGLRWSGDPGVLPVRHSVERARTATRMVPPLSRRADGAPGGCGRGWSTVESGRWPVGTSAAPRVAAHLGSTPAGLPVDSGAPRRRTAHSTRATVPGAHPALRCDSALGIGRPGGSRSRGSRNTHGDRPIG